jgi:hypothetical protein
MTNQEAFDKALAAMRLQGKPSFKTVEREDMSVDAYCAYRGDNGLRCAIGALVPDERYSPAWDVEEKNVYKIQDDLVFLGLGLEFMLELQRAIHDGPATSDKPFLEEVEVGAKAFAKRFHLTYREPTS